MNFTSEFKRAFIRRLVYVFVAAVLAWVGVGTARAQAGVPGGVCATAEAGCTREEAWAHCQSKVDSWIALGPQNAGAFCSDTPNPYWPGLGTVTASQPGYGGLGTWYYGKICNEGYTWDDATKTCKPPCDHNGPPLSGGFMKYTGSEPGYQTCHDGCEYNPSSMTFQTGTVDGISYVSLNGWIPSGATCTVGANDDYTPPSDSDGDGVSDGNDPAPNNPGESGNTGDNPPSGDGNGDGDGSGNGNQSVGGGSCASAPSSSGDQILGQIAYQAWATRCAIENAKDGNGNLRTTQGEGTGTGTGTGTGNGTQQGNGSCGDGTVNAAICATKELVKKISDFVDGLSGEAAGLDNDPGDDTDPMSIWGDPPDEADLDEGGLGWGRACPTLPQVSLPGYSGPIDNGLLCTTFQAIGALVLLLAYFQAGLIVGRP